MRSEELKRAVTPLGAAGVMVPGTTGARTLDHPDLYPFWDLVGDGIVDLLPKLRFGLLETGCGWLPYFSYAAPR